MECEYCENHYCSTCLGMTDTEYEHHVHSSGMWFCGICKPKVEETLKIEKEIEKRCSVRQDGTRFDIKCAFNYSDNLVIINQVTPVTIQIRTQIKMVIW